MQDRTLYAQLLGIEKPWKVTDVSLRLDDEKAVVVSVEMDPEAPLHCPKFQTPGSRYDSRARRWRHLDTMQYHTTLVAEVPRVQCEERGVIQVDVAWADSKSRFPALFEALCIDWLEEASFSALARQLSLRWDQVAGIQDRAVRRGLARRETQRPRRIGIDETSFRQCAEYIKIVNDLGRNRVLWIGDNRQQETLIKYDWDGVINAATTHVTNARNEALSRKIQWIKRMACGYRNRKRFHDAIYFHLADLDPSTVASSIPDRSPSERRGPVYPGRRRGR